MNKTKDIVKEGYDRLSSEYRKHYESSHNGQYLVWLNELLDLIPAHSNVLELGCGDGIPIAKVMANEYNYIGIDISPIQIQQATRNVPAATFVVGDMTELNFSADSFQCVIALYSIIHVPIAEQEELLKQIFYWLRDDGYCLCTVGFKEWTGTEDNWIQLKTAMYWSHTDSETYEIWFNAIGFSIQRKEFVAEGNAGHVLFLLKKSKEHAPHAS
jgi:ubiquinone/menaquinone biosynthesis C-methylase UbiE